MQEGDAAREMVEHEKRAWGHVMHRRHGICAHTARRQTLKEAHHVIRGVADEATRERDARHLRQWARRLQERATQHVQQFPCAPRCRLRAALDGSAAGCDLKFQAIPEADEGVAREPLAALDALEQEARM